MNKAFVIGVTTALALGYAGGFTTNGLVAKAGQERPANTIVTKSYDTSVPAVSNLWSTIKSVGCVDADTQLEMDAGSCAAEMAPCSEGTVFSMTCAPEGRTNVAIGFQFKGFWTPGLPQ